MIRVGMEWLFLIPFASKLLEGMAAGLVWCGIVCWFLRRIRVSEGFHFAASGEGIVSMVIELPMKVNDTRTPNHLKHKLLTFSICTIWLVSFSALQCGFTFVCVPDLFPWIEFLSSGNVRGHGQREPLLHCSVHPVSTSLYIYKGQVRPAVISCIEQKLNS